jgi:hypothetical protein
VKERKNMYKQKILNDFDEELFSTDYNDYATATQNAKTDLFCDNHKIDFKEWLADLVKTFCEDNNEYTVAEVNKAIEQEPKFLEDLQEEFIYLREEALEMFDYDEEDEEEDED